MLADGWNCSDKTVDRMREPGPQGEAPVLEEPAGFIGRSPFWTTAPFSTNFSCGFSESFSGMEAPEAPAGATDDYPTYRTGIEMNLNKRG